MKATVITAGLALLLLGAGAAHAQENATYKRDLPARLAKRAKITEEKAAAIARDRVTSGTIQAVELEEEGGRLIYSYDMTVPGRRGTEEVNIDAVKGTVVGVHHETAATEKKEAAAERKHKGTKSPSK